MSCPNIIKVLFGSPLNIKFPDFPETTFEEWLFNIILNKDAQITITVAAIINSIWFARNLCIF